jgi:hypothetical protein
MIEKSQQHSFLDIETVKQNFNSLDEMQALWEHKTLPTQR